MQIVAVSKKQHIMPFNTACTNGCLHLLELSDASSSASWHRGTCLEDSQFLRLHMPVGR